MRILVVAATVGEISLTYQYLAENWERESIVQFKKGEKEVLICFPGVGMVATTHTLTKALHQFAFDFVIQAGVGGAFDRNLKLGDVVFVTSEQFGDLGAEDRENNLDLFEMGLGDANMSPFIDGRLLTPVSELHNSIKLARVSGLTVNSVSGNEKSIRYRAEKYSCSVESMEGAAFHYVCLEEHVPFAQVRSISNYVEPRDKSKWKMKEAIISLNDWLINFLEEW